MAASNEKLTEATRLVHAARGAGAVLPAETVGPAVQRGSTVLVPDVKALYASDRPTYGRQGLASQKAMQAAMCELEGATYCQLYNSGLAAVTGALMSILTTGDVLLVTDGVYGPVRRFCDGFLARFGVRTVYYPADGSVEDILALAPPQTRALLIESPASLTFEMIDAPALAAACRARDIITLADNTWAAGLAFKPLQHGVDISIQALTKYVCGHSDAFLGSACVRDPKLEAEIRKTMVDAGFSVSGEDAALGLRGLRTLKTRYEAQGAAGLKVAEWMAAQPEVARILHPAMAHDRGHGLWRRDYAGTCSLFGVELKNFSSARVEAMLNGLELFGLGFSWGGFESLTILSKPVKTLAPWTSGPLIRLHVGLEDPDDLIADLRRGLDRLHG